MALTHRAGPHSGQASYHLVALLEFLRLEAPLELNIGVLKGGGVVGATPAVDFALEPGQLVSHGLRVLVEVHRRGGAY